LGSTSQVGRKKNKFADAFAAAFVEADRGEGGKGVGLLDVLALGVRLLCSSMLLKEQKK
jgi:hypothetical protein